MHALSFLACFFSRGSCLAFPLRLSKGANVKVEETPQPAMRQPHGDGHSWGCVCPAYAASVETFLTTRRCSGKACAGGARILLVAAVFRHVLDGHHAATCRRRNAVENARSTTRGAIVTLQPKGANSQFHLHPISFLKPLTSSFPTPRHTHFVIWGCWSGSFAWERFLCCHGARATRGMCQKAPT